MRKRNNTYLDQLKFGFIILALAALAQVCFGQTISYDDTQNIEYTATIANGTDFDSYKTKAGTVLKIGDKLIIGRPSTNTNLFTYILLGRFSLGSALLATPQAAPGNITAEEVVIDKISVQHSKMSRKSPLNMFVYVRNKKFPESINSRTIGDYDKAVELGEVINLNDPPTREQAIMKLKESKELFELGVITQAKYDSMRAVLAPIITGN
jgi:hypothetical protein